MLVTTAVVAPQLQHQYLALAAGLAALAFGYLPQVSSDATSPYLAACLLSADLPEPDYFHQAFDVIRPRLQVLARVLRWYRWPSRQ
jgi:hypothetical protein